MARTHVVLTEELLASIDREVGQRGRSRFLEQAAHEKLARLDLERALEQAAGSVRASDHPHWRNRTATAEWVRKERSSPDRETRRRKEPA